jgi:hypothetical protein
VLDYRPLSSANVLNVPLKKLCKLVTDGSHYIIIATWEAEMGRITL